MDRALNKIVHECGDGWIKNEGNQEEEAKNTNNTQGTKEETCVVLYIIQSVQYQRYFEYLVKGQF